MLLIAAVLFACDSREVMGINVWIKPMKFMASITIYLLTVAWLIAYLERPAWVVRTHRMGCFGLHGRRDDPDLHSS